MSQTRSRYCPICRTRPRIVYRKDNAYAVTCKDGCIRVEAINNTYTKARDEVRTIWSHGCEYMYSKIGESCDE